MLYFSIFIFIAALAIYEIFYKELPSKLFNIVYFMISAIACFRYGTGTDYYGYMKVFQNTGVIYDISFFTKEVHSEWGFKLFISILKTIGLNYMSFIFIITAIITILFYIFIRKNSKLRMVLLFIFYSMYYFTYVNSGIRQGLVIALFLTILLPLIKAKNFKKLVVLTIAFAFIHISVLIVLIIPLFHFKLTTKRAVVLMVIAFVLGVVDIGFLLKPIGPLYKSYLYYADQNVSLPAIASRIIMFLMVLFLFNHATKEDEAEYDDLLKFYFVGLIVYMVFVKNSLISSRLNVYFKSFELILLPNLLYLSQRSVKRNLAAIAICLVMPIMWYKEINAAIIQGYYYKKNVLQYPYVSVFNSKDIYQHRNIFKVLEKIHFWN